jgi:hypothetical protein
MSEIIKLWDECLEFCSNGNSDGAAMHLVMAIDAQKLVTEND